jgi:hypothetical protein
MRNTVLGRIERDNSMTTVTVQSGMWNNVEGGIFG